jgi:hypothetical protein
MTGGTPTVGPTSVAQMIGQTNLRVVIHCRWCSVAHKSANGDSGRDYVSQGYIRGDVGDFCILCDTTGGGGGEGREGDARQLRCATDRSSKRPSRKTRSRPCTTRGGADKGGCQAVLSRLLFRICQFVQRGGKVGNNVRTQYDVGQDGCKFGSDRA